MSTARKPKVDLAQLRAREAELAERVEATRTRLNEYSGLIAQARREAVYAGKARSGGELTGPVEMLRKKERQDASALPGLEGDLSAVRSVIAEESVQAMTETGNYDGVYETRPAGLVTTEVRRRLDAHDRLFHLIKPLGDVVLKLQLSGRIPTITSE
jgi:hypothetical protein